MILIAKFKWQNLSNLKHKKPKFVDHELVMMKFNGQKIKLLSDWKQDWREYFKEKLCELLREVEWLNEFVKLAIMCKFSLMDVSP